MPAFYKTFVKCCVSLLLAISPNLRVDGCYDGYDAESYRISWFNPGIDTEPSLSAFFYTQNIIAPENSDVEETDFRQNCREWVNYLGADVKADDVLKILYHTNKEWLLNDYALGHLQQNYPHNTFINALLKPDKTEVLNYLILAFRAEFAHFSAKKDPWEIDEDNDYRDQILRKVITVAEQKVNGLRDSFLIQRYAYQLVLQNRYLENYEDCQRYFQTFFAKEKKSILAPWAMLHCAYSLGQMGDSIQSAYYLSQVFDRSASKRIVCPWYFSPKNINAVLDLAQNDHEKAVIWALKSFRYPGQALNDINEMLKLDPSCNLLPMMIGREVNKLEAWILTPQVTFFGREDGNNYVGFDETNSLFTADLAYFKANQVKDRAYLRQFRTMLEQHITNQRSKEQDFLHLVLAHLYFMEGQQAGKVESQLAAISQNANPQIQLQMHIERLLNLPALVNIRTDEAKDAMTKLFGQIAALSQYMPTGVRFYPKLLLHFSRLFQREHDTVTAGLLYNRAATIPSNAYAGYDYYNPISYFDRYADLKDLAQVIQLLQKKEKSRFELFLTAPWNKLELNRSFRTSLSTRSPQPSVEQLLDLKGVIAFRQNNLSAALEAFQQLPDYYWDSTYAFKNYLRQDIFSESNLLPTEGAELTSCNKKKQLARMIELQHDADHAGPQQAPALYLLGNAYYNTSYWGQSWMMSCYGQSNSEPFYGDNYWYDKYSLPARNQHQEVYYELSRAIQSYQKALESKPDIDLATRITYMLAQCDELRQRALHKKKNPRDFWGDSKQDPPYLSPYYKTLKNRYGKTAAFEEIIMTCPLLEEFLQGID